MAPSILQNKIVSFHTAAADDLILAAGDLIFSTNTKIRDEAARVADFAFRDLHARSACVLYIGTTFGENYQKHFAAHFAELGGTVAYSELTKLEDSDLRGVLTKVKNSSCDVFFAAYFGTNLGLVLKQAHSIGVRKTTLSVYEAEDPSVIEVAGEAAEGLKFFVAEPMVDNEITTSFKNRFTKQFGYAPRILASNAYDATTILALKLSQCKGDSECAKNKIYEIRDYVGVSGTFSIDPDGAAQKTFVLKTVKNGRFVRETSPKS
jgi:branched-chain amino acid transport system substrate-binding protein